MLKNSARNWRLPRSVMRVFLITEKSKSSNPGPVTTLRPEFPNVNGALGVKALRLNQSETLCGPLFGSPLALGRSFPSPVLLLFRPVSTENGCPDCRVRMPASCQPLVRRLGPELYQRSNGSCQMKDPLKRCRMSKSESPRSPSSRLKLFCGRTVEPLAPEP